MKEKITGFVRRQAVLCISAVLTMLSAFFAPPSAAWLEAIDWRVLILLFCLMAVVSGLENCGFFEELAGRVLRGEKSLRLLALLLVLLPFFSAMCITNDVALLVFVPFAVLVLDGLGREDFLIRVIVLQTAAANLGSMATPVGNPQNLYLYTTYGLTAGDFFRVMLPLTLLSLAALAVGALATGRGSVQIGCGVPDDAVHGWRRWIWFGLFALCLLAVFRVLNVWVLLGIVAVGIAVTNRKIFAKVDYCLLLTFICFFIFADNIGTISAVRDFLQTAMENHALLTPVLTSQVISNVPAAVLLSGFTENSRALLLGTNVGGLGTPVASLASLISLKIYMARPHADAKRYLLVFLAVNVAGLVVLGALAGLML